MNKFRRLLLKNQYNRNYRKYCLWKQYFIFIFNTDIYYVLEGTGVFKIESDKYNVEQGDVIEIPPNTEFVFVGKMKLLLIMNPAFNKDNEVDGAYNDLYMD